MSRPLFPKIAPFANQMLKVSDVHNIYVEQSGNTKGIPVLYLHGGPGAGCSIHHRRLFDPEIYHIIMFDQRGCGRSLPSPSIEENTFEFVIEDIEAIRYALGIDKWLVCGGSWGTTLALLYAIKYPERCLGFILRGLFLASLQELHWLYSDKGVAKFFPEFYQDFVKPIRRDAIKQDKNEYDEKHALDLYAEIIGGGNELAGISASKSWFLWEQRISSLEHQGLEQLFIEDTHQAHCMALLSSYYFASIMSKQHDDSLSFDILEYAQKFSHLPAIIINGRLDMVCPLENAYKLTKVWPNAQLQILPVAGHGGFERTTVDAFVKASDAMARFLKDDFSGKN